MSTSTPGTTHRLRTATTCCSTSAGRRSRSGRRGARPLDAAQRWDEEDGTVWVDAGSASVFGNPVLWTSPLDGAAGRGRCCPTVRGVRSARRRRVPALQRLPDPGPVAASVCSPSDIRPAWCACPRSPAPQTAGTGRPRRPPGRQRRPARRLRADTRRGLPDPGPDAVASRSLHGRATAGRPALAHLRRVRRGRGCGDGRGVRLRPRCRRHAGHLSQRRLGDAGSGEPSPRPPSTPTRPSRPCCSPQTTDSPSTARWASAR